MATTAFAEFQRRMGDPSSRINANTDVRIDEYRRDLPDDGFWD